MHYDCAGAGQRATALTSDPAARNEAFRLLRELHELRLLLAAARELVLAPETEAQRSALERAAIAPIADADALARFPIAELARATHALLRSLRPLVRRRAQPSTIV